ncbi:hypothetical protein E2C01_013122 [Portunus trituberculatus]|uniref:Uncharacterized protein n=1 Tax=Portunus trituberculatus TaxID=210409 RepID=A0A5B7DFT8_PORTR|nr:hypothetical protein [Portunus trituberculatus]
MIARLVTPPPRSLPPDTSGNDFDVAVDGRRCSRPAHHTTGGQEGLVAPLTGVLRKCQERRSKEI